MIRVVSGVGGKLREGIEQGHSCECHHVCGVPVPPGSRNGVAWPYILCDYINFTSLCVSSRKGVAPLQYWRHPSARLSPSLCLGALSFHQPLMG